MPSNPPQGYHTLTPQTIVDDAAETIAFVEAVFDAEVEEVYESDGFIQHAQVRIGDSPLMLASSYVRVVTSPRALWSTSRTPCVEWWFCSSQSRHALQS